MTSLRESQTTPAAIAGRRLVRVRLYARTVDGRVQQVGGTTPSHEAQHSGSSASRFKNGETFCVDWYFVP
jgi:hypothetical protein